MGFIQTWRWYGPSDIVTLSDIRQAGATGIVTALHHLQVGDVWSTEEIQTLQDEIAASGLSWEVVESVNVHESIKLGLPECELYLEHYRQTLTNLASCGIQTVCYNFMPVLDWTRTDLSFPTASGTRALRYDHIALAAFDLFQLKRAQAPIAYTQELSQKAEEFWASLNHEKRLELQHNILAGLPGTQDRLSLEAFRHLLEQYKSIDATQLRQHLRVFLDAVVPVAQEHGIKLAMHPDDPPYAIFGLPRIMSTETDFDFLLSCRPEKSNGITFCTGSLAPLDTNELPKMIKRFADRIHFVHLRNIQRQTDGSFYEADHLQGTVDMYAVVKELLVEMGRRHSNKQEDYQIPMRPDHGHQMLDDMYKEIPFPGYAAIGRLKGLAELRGLQLGIEREHHLQ